MRILHLAWEYPPVLYGGLGRHVHALAGAQAANGHEVTVITQGPRGSGPAPDPVDDGNVRVLRVAADPARHDPGDLLGHVASMEWAFTTCGEDLFAEWRPDVVHAHDWMVSHAAVVLRSSCDAPLVATLHATEAGRNQGWVMTGLSTTIHSLEWWLATTADGLITCSTAMDHEVRSLFGVGPTHVIPNGIDLNNWHPPNGALERVRAANADAHPLLAYTGRVEWEKGVQTIIEAMPALRAAHPDIRLLVAGRGTYLPALQSLAGSLGVADCVRFLGWVSEADLRAVVAASAVAIAPSLYEPFGLVALEAAALGTPVVVADTGGLAEFADQGSRALTFLPGSPASLAAAVERDLRHPEAAQQRAARASQALAVQYDWRVIAEETVACYRQAQGALGGVGDDGRAAEARARRAVEPPAFVAPLGHVLDLHG